VSATLRHALGALCVDSPEGLVAAPSTERELMEVLHILADQGAALHHDVVLSRARMVHVGRIAPKGMLVEAEAGVTLEKLEATLTPHRLTLGPLSPSAWGLPLGDFLEGGYCGLRAIRGGRLEPVATRIEGLLSDGSRLATLPGPRSATGPDLLALFLGGRGRLAVATRAVVRCYEVPHGEHVMPMSFPTAQGAIDVLTRSLAAGCLPSKVRLEHRGGRWLAFARWQGSPGAMERDRDVWARELESVGGRPAGDTESTPLDGPEREATWDDVLRALEQEKTLELYRPCLATCVVRGDVDGVRLDEPGQWTLAQGLARAMDPRGVLGGAR